MITASQDLAYSDPTRMYLLLILQIKFEGVHPVVYDEYINIY
jgi:hypothetical protein